MRGIEFVSVLAAVTVVVFVAPGGHALCATVEKLSPERLTDMLDFTPRTVYFGGAMIGTGDTMAGPVVVVLGALDVQDGGALTGDAWVVNGRLILNGRAAVTGDVNLVNSTEFVSRHAFIGGGVHHYSCECALDDELFESQGEVVFVKKDDPAAIKIRPKIAPGALNRTEYTIVKVGFDRENTRRKDPYVKGHVLLHVPIWKESGGFLGFDVGMTVPLGERRLELLLEGFKRSWTTDDWQLSRIENACIVGLVGNDFADYYEKRGGSAGVRYRPAEPFAIEATVGFQEEVSLEASAIPSLLRGKDVFEENPAIDDGNRFLVSGRISYDTRMDRDRPLNAWNLSLLVEKGLAEGPGDFSYTAFGVDASRYSSLPVGMRLDLRGKLFSAFDPIPRQATMSMNGYGGIRGLGDDPFPVHRGNRLLLFSAELRKGLPDIPFVDKLFTRWNLLLFSDVGLLEDEEHDRRPFDFLGAPIGDWGKSVGIGVSAESFLPYVGIYMAQDIDRDEFAPRFIIRARRSF